MRGWGWTCPGCGLHQPAGSGQINECERCGHAEPRRAGRLAQNDDEPRPHVDLGGGGRRILMTGSD